MEFKLVCLKIVSYFVFDLEKDALILNCYDFLLRENYRECRWK